MVILSLELPLNNPEEMTDILRNHTFVGMANEDLGLIQHATTLYAVKVKDVA